MRSGIRPLGSISTVAAVVESGSFARAAAALAITPSAVSRAISRIERELGVRLFHRTTRSLRLTAEGRAFYSEIAPLLDGLDDALTRARGAATSVQGRLRVNIDPFFSRLLVAPRVGSFLKRHPNLSLELITRDSLGDLVAEGFDLAIRFGPPPTSSLVARKLLDTRILTVASPTYLERHGRPDAPSELRHHSCIQFRDPDTGQPFAWEFHRGRKILPVETHGPLLLTDVATMLNACLAGVGIAQVMALGIEKLLQQERLLELFPDWPGETFPLFALYPSRSLPPAKLRAFLDFITAMLLQAPLKTRGTSLARQ